MKIGILTFHSAYNFGAVLQGFALQETLKLKGHEVEFINYTNPKVEQSYKQFQCDFYSLAHPRSSFYTFVKGIYRTCLFHSYRKKAKCLLQISRFVTTTTHYDFSSYDVIIVGSDQLWSKKITGDYDFFYCAKFNRISRKNVFGYAISINQSKFSDDEINEIKGFLPYFNNISVRETLSAKLLNELKIKDVQQTIDPTFLLPKFQWQKFVRFVPEKNYICVFPILNAPQVIAQAKIIAGNLHKQLIIMEPIANVSPFTDYKKLTHPFEFISYIANADMVLTSSFHGTAFSLIFERQFYVLGDDSTNVRMRNFLDELNLMNRIIPSDQTIGLEECKIDYTKVNKYIEEKVKISKQFLLNSLDTRNIL